MKRRKIIVYLKGHTYHVEFTFGHSKIRSYRKKIKLKALTTMQTVSEQVNIFKHSIFLVAILYNAGAMLVLLVHTFMRVVIHIDLFFSNSMISVCVLQH